MSVDKKTDADRAAAAQRQRRTRARRRHGEALYHLILPEHPVLNALISSGRMSEDATRRRTLVEQALVGVVVEWTKRWKD